MNAQREIRSDNKFKVYMTLLCAFIVFLCFIAFMISRHAFDHKYPDMMSIIISCVTIGMAVFCAGYFSKFRKLHIHDGQLDIQDILGRAKTLYLREIKGWIAIDKADKYQKWQELTIYTDNSKYTIPSSLYNNYETLKQALTKGKARDTHKEFEIKYRKAIITDLAVIGLGLLFAGIGHAAYSSTHKGPVPLAVLKGTIANQPHITKGSKGSRYLDIKLAEYPDFEFSISGKEYRKTYANDYVDYKHIGDTILLSIEQDTYKKKITEEKPLSFFDKTMHYYNIAVYGLQDSRKVFLSSEHRNEEDSSNSGVLFMYIIGGAMVIGGMVAFFYLPKENTI